jgi:ribosome recycling factor
MVKELEDDGTISSDDKRRVEKQVQDLTDEYVKKIDEMIAHKEKEVLEV